MSYLYAIILGIVEGVSEFLPISSTGHLIIAGHLLNLPASEFWKSFEVIIQLGAILSVAALYGKTLWQKKDLAVKIIVAFIPTAVLGLIFYKFIKQHLLGNLPVVLWALLIGGIIMIVLEKYYSHRTPLAEETDHISYKHCLILGFCQSLAMIPGVSRSAATIMGGLALKIPRRTIVEFSFLLALPTMLAASGLDLVKTGANFSGQEYLLLAVGFVSSFIVALFSVKWLLGYIQKNSFISFGVYRIVVAGFFWLLLLR